MRLRMNIAATVALLTGAFAGVAQADHWRQTADPQVVQALNELMQVYNYYCNSGDQYACNSANNVYQSGLALLNAGYDCQAMNNRQACQYYEGSYNELAMAYNQINQVVPQQQYADLVNSGNPLGGTHGERMDTIAAWGQDRLDWGTTQGALMDSNHDAFMQTLRGD